MQYETSGGYLFLIDDILLPVTPGRLIMKIRGKNKTINLASGEEINILNPAGLTDFEFDALFPAQEYSFSRYMEGFRSPAWFLLQFSKILESEKPCRLRVIRERYIENAVSRKISRRIPFNQDVRVSIESCQVKEDAAAQGKDMMLSFKLKQYPAYGTKIVRVLGEGDTATVETDRETDNAPQAETHMVKIGDSLWSIAKHFTGNGSKYTELMAANGLTGTTIYEGQVLRLPW